MKVVKEEMDVVLYATLAELHEMIADRDFSGLETEDEEMPERLKIVGEGENVVTPRGEKTTEARAFEMVFTQFLAELAYVDRFFHEIFGCVGEENIEEGG